MIKTIENLLGKLAAKKEQEAVSTAESFRRLVRDAVDGRLNADQLEAGLAVTGRTVQDLQTHAETLVRRRELATRVVEGEKAAAELARIEESMAEANEVYQVAVQKFETTYGPLRIKAEELRCVIANGEQGAKMLEQEAGKLDPESLVPFVAKRDEVYETTAADVEAKATKRSEIGNEHHRVVTLSGGSAEDRERVVPAFNAACKALTEAEKPRIAADEELRRAKLKPELI